MQRSPRQMPPPTTTASDFFPQVENMTALWSVMRMRPTHPRKMTPKANIDHRASRGQRNPSGHEQATLQLS